MKNLIKIFLIISLGFSSVFALNKDEIKPKMAEKIDNVLVILGKKELTNDQKGEQIIKIIDEVFDYNLMAMLSLGKQTWVSINSQQRAEFTELFEEKLKKSYIDKLKLYNDQKVKIIGLKDHQGSRAQLQTELLGKDKTYQINYNFYENRKDKQWYIYDVDLVGVSIIKTYQLQFNGQLKEKTFDELLEELKDSLANETK